MERTVPRNQLWFHHLEMQERVRRAETDFAEGRSTRTETLDEARALLDSLKGRGTDGSAPAPESLDKVGGPLPEHESIDQLFAAWSSAVARRDVEALLGMITADAEFWTHGAPALAGHAAIRAMFETFFGQFELRQEFERLEILIGDDLAVVRGIEHNYLTPIGGGETIQRDQRAISILLRQPGGQWRFARGMTNLPPASASPT